ncbi:MAG: serine/threonine-protein kinase, partial [Planctomycetota bacterium]
MDPQSYSRLQAIVEEALATPDPRARVEALCAGEEDAFRARALELLTLMEDGDGVFSDAEVARQRERLDGAVEAGDDPDGWVPETIGRYRVVRPLGRGGSGVVFLARQAQPERLVAVKLIHPLLATSGTLERLQREAEILGALSHPGIAQIFEAGSADLGFGPQPFLAMEWVDGVDLVEHCGARRPGGDALRERVELVVRVAEALVHAHARGVVHRDLKPDNVLVDADGSPKVLDFGIAALRDASEGGRITLDADVLGTLAYMAPEQARGARAVSPRADVYSLGAIAYELVTGRRPRRVEGLSITDVLRELNETTPLPARAVAPDVPRDLETVLAKALESDPSRRYPSVGAFRTDLIRFLEHRPVSARPPSLVDRAWKFTRRHPALVGGVGATLFTLLAGALIALVLARRAQRAERDAQFERYAAEMLVATGRLTDPVLRGRAKDLALPWAPGTALGTAVDARTSGRWEWHLLDSVDREAARELDVDAPTDVDWSEDGARVLVAHSGGVRVFEAATGALLDELSVALEPTQFVADARWDPTGDGIVLAGAGLVARWRPGRATVDWTVPAAFVPAVGFVRAGGADLVLTVGNEAGLYRLDDGERVRGYQGGLADMERIETSLDGREALVCVDAWSGPIVWLDPVTGARRDAGFMVPRRPTAFALSRSGDRIATVNRGGDLFVHDAGTGAELVQVALHDAYAFYVEWSPDDALLATVSDDRTVRIVDPVDGCSVDVLDVHDASTRKVAWSPDGAWLATTAWGGRAFLSPLAARAAVRRLARGNGHSYEDQGRLSASRDGARLLVGRRDGSALFDLEAEERLPETELAPGGFLSPDGSLVAAVTGRETIELRRTEGGALVRVLDVPSVSQLSCDWTPSGDALVCASQSGVFVVPLAGGLVARPRKLYERFGQTRCTAVDPAGRRVAVQWTDETITVTDLRSGETREIVVAFPGWGRSIAWSPDGGRLA